MGNTVSNLVHKKEICREEREGGGRDKRDIGDSDSGWSILCACVKLPTINKKIGNKKV